MILWPAMRRSAPGVVVLACVLGAGATTARAAPPGWLATHAQLELTAGPAWRVAIPSTPRASGFQAITFGGELLLGADVRAWLAIVGGARARIGTVGGGRYAELAGSLAVQARVSERVRLRLGGDGGRAFNLESGASPGLVGGWLETAIDVLAVGGRSAITLTVRLDLGTFLAPDASFPDVTLAFGVGLGGRY